MFSSLKFSQPTLSPIMLGLFFMLLSTAAFAAMNITIRHLSATMDTVQIVFLRNVISTGLLLPLVFHHGVEKLKTTHFWRHFWRALIGIIGMELWFYTIAVLPINIATALSFTAPLFTTIIAVLFQQEKIGWRRVLALLLGFGGVIIILRPGAEGVNPTMMIVLLATVFWAIASNLVKSLTRREPTWKIIFYMSVLMTLFSAPISLLSWSPPVAGQWVWLLLIAIFALAAHFSMVAAFARVDMVTLMPIDFMRLVFTALLAYAFLNETIDSFTTIGAAVIVGSAVYIAWRERKAKKKSSKAIACEKTLEPVDYNDE